MAELETINLIFEGWGKQADGLSKIHTTNYQRAHKLRCYIASVNTKRDWLICSHVALDKCNVSRPGNK